MGQNIRLPPLFSDNMVLQQARDARGSRDETVLWGWARSRAALRVSWSGESTPEKAKFTRSNREWYLWEVKLPDLKPGIYEFAITQETEKVVLTNVLIGEVWISAMPSLEHVPIPADKTNSIHYAIDQKVRVLRLTRLHFDPREEPIPGWTELTAWLHEDWRALPLWNFRFAEAVFSQSKGSVAGMGLVVLEPALFANLGKTAVPSANHLRPDLRWIFEALGQASYRVIEDHDAAETDYQRLVSLWKRRGQGNMAPRPDLHISTFRQWYFHENDLPEVRLSIRGAVWCKP